MSACILMHLFEVQYGSYHGQLVYMITTSICNSVTSQTPNKPRHTDHFPYCFLRVILEAIIQVASLASLAQLLPPRSPTVRNLAPDMQLSVQTACRAAPRLRPLQLLLAACVLFSCYSRARLRHPLQLLFPLCLRCCSPIASAARRLHPLQLLLPIASTSAATPRLRPLQLLLPDCGFQPMPGPKVLEHSSRSSRLSKVRRSRVTIV